MSTPTGRIERRGGQHVLVLSRELRAPLEDVWAAVTEPQRLARWIGTWQGDPASGSVAFRMLFEGDEAPDEKMEIRVCEPPQRLHVTSRNGDEVWHLDLDLTHADGVTTLTLSQSGVTQDQVADVGPGWEYYLDRLVDAESGADPAARDFERDYHPAMSSHFTDQLP